MRSTRRSRSTNPIHGILTIGDPLAAVEIPRRLDDEQVMYPFLRQGGKSGITTLCIPRSAAARFEKSFAAYGSTQPPGNIGKLPKMAAVNFVIITGRCVRSSSCLTRPGPSFRSTGRIPWATISGNSEKFGVTNVHRRSLARRLQLGRGASKFCAALVGTLIKGHGGRSCPMGYRLGFGTGRRSGRSRRCVGSKS